MLDDTPSRLWQEILSRPDGPLAMRFYLQPLMSLLFAMKDGLNDARTGAPPYFWAMFSEPGQRMALIRDGWRSVGKIFVLAIILDVIYQFIVFGGWRPLQGFFIAVALALVPYLTFRGIVNRIARTVRPRPAAASQRPR